MKVIENPSLWFVIPLAVLIVFAGIVVSWFIVSPQTLITTRFDRPTRDPITSFDDVFVEKPVNMAFSLFAPQVNINVPIKKNIDASVEYNYLPQVLQGVAHYRRQPLGDVMVDGALPGSGEGNIFLFGHSQIPGRSTDNYQGVLNDLEDFVMGDVLSVFYEDAEYRYKVVDAKVTEKTDLSIVEYTETETLTLMSCWPLGLDLKRYVVRAERVF